MFTWICPQCGREVPPAYNECPDCTNKTAPGVNPPTPEPIAQSPVAAAPPPPPPSPPEYTPPVYTLAQPPTQPPQPVYPQQPYPARAPSFLGQLEAGPPYAVPPPPRRGLPTWLMTIVFTLAFLGLVAGIYWTVGYLRGGASTPAPSITVESPAAKPGAKTSPLQKYIEIAGVRFHEDAKKKPAVTFIIVNHSGAEIGELAGNVTVWGRTRTSEEEAAGTFTFKTSLRPNESKELTAPLTTKLKFYELPDWQNVSTDIQITAPAASGGSAALR